jgi:TPP-dependent pyruvate/acetoin dehydrogenase alpha subunit
MPLSNHEAKFWRSMCRIHWFEELCHAAIEDGRIKNFTYLASGQESVAAAIAAAFSAGRINVFPQHRNHDSYLSFGGDLTKLRDELLGLETGTTKGIGGDPMHAFVDDRVRYIGHSGLVGDSLPIAVGMAYATKEWSIVFMGDATCEEETFAPSIGFAKTHELPVLFVCTDNDLSVITTKEKRRSWDVVDVARGYGVDALHLSDNPFEICACVKALRASRRPALINIPVQRKYRHVGAGVDGPMAWDRMQLTRDMLALYDPDQTREIEEAARKEMEVLWTQA